jgi:hypothetical protein
VLRMFYSANITGDASNQITATLSGGATAQYFAVGVYQFSGLGSSSPLESTASGSGAGTTLLTAGTLITRAADAVIVGMMEADGSTLAAGSGYTLTAFAGASGQFFGTTYKIVSASEAATATCGVGSWGILAAMFSVLPAGGGTYTAGPRLVGGGLVG